MAPRQQGGLRVLVSDERGRRVAARGVSGWLARVAPARARGLVSVAFVSDRRVRALNRRYRGIDRSTDVLSFPTQSSSPRRTRSQPTVLTSVSSASSVVDIFLGDIVIARGVARRQAHRSGHSELTEWRVLALHGLLHLLGYDHHRDGGRMRRIEQRLRRAGGLREGLIERARTK